MGSNFSVQNGAPHRLAIEGELDLASAPELEHALEHVDGDVTVDFAGLAFIDSSGLNALLRARKAREASGHHLSVTGVNGHCLRVFQISGVASTFNLPDATDSVSA